MTNVGAVSELWRYPVKSMGGDSFDALRIGERGVIGDRGWAVRDEVRGGIRGAKKIGGLMRLQARYEEEPTDGEPPPVAITTPDGSTIRSGDPDANERLSAALDHAVTLWPLQPPTDLEHYRRGKPDIDDFVGEWRQIFGREPDEPLPSLEGFPLDVLGQYESPPGTYFDAFSIHLITTRSLETLAKLAPEADIDVRRFRPNLVVDVSDDVDGEFPEQDWIGKSLRVGDVELDIVTHCPRCVMVTRPQAELGEDRQVLRTIVRHANQNVGVYANVRVTGSVRAGDTATLS
jgi:uncharacterized protein